MIGIAECGDANCSSLQILDRLNLAGGPRRGDNGEQGEAPRDREATDVRADIGIGLDGDIQRGGSVVDGAADQRLHRGVAAAGIDELHIKPLIFEVTGRSRDLVRNAAQKLTAIGQLDLLALSLGLGGSRRRNDACDQRSPLEQRTPRHFGTRYAGGGFIAAAHGESPNSGARRDLPRFPDSIAWQRVSSRCRERICGVIVLMAVVEPAWPKEIEQARSQPKPSTCDRSQFRVVLDVGHTVDAPGAISARNVPEYDFNLRLAKYLERRLIEDGFTKTVLLVTGGRARPSLFARAAKANGLSANLLVSIHHDSVPDSLMESWEFEGKQGHFSDRFRGYSIFVSYENPHLDRSLLFGRLLGNELKDRGLQYARQYTQPIMGRY